MRTLRKRRQKRQPRRKRNRAGFGSGLGIEIPWPLATENWILILWRIKKDRALHETVATRTRSGSASRLLADNWSPAARSSSVSVERGLNLGSTLGAAKTTRFSPRSRDALSSST